MSKDLILFVEDNTDFRDSAARFLALHDYEVMVASDGLEALTILDNKLHVRPKVIISDISMPNMNGYEFFEAVRKRPHLKIVPFVFLTALDARDDFKLGWDVGVDDYFVKPFRPEEFLHIIQNRIKRYDELIGEGSVEVSKARDSIVKILSHELRTPLTYVTGGFTLLHDVLSQNELSTLGDSVDSVELQRILQFIRNGTERLTRLAEQTVLLTEITSSSDRHIWSRLAQMLDVQEIIDSAIRKLQPVIVEREIQIETGIESIRVYGVLNPLIIAIAEPLRNALLFSAHGQTVTIKAYRTGEDDNIAVIEIRDEGSGMLAEDIDRVWDLMVQSEREEQEQQGFGLGLPLTREIINLHDGEAYLDSEKGVGTTVYLRLPIRDTF